MASTHRSVLPHASGLVHRNVLLTTHYLVVDNRFAQHHGLSLLAIGLGVHIQSLPVGAKVSIKAIAAKFPESELRVARAFRELELWGFLARIRERLPDGRIVPRTISYNRPVAEPRPVRETPNPTPDPDPEPDPEPEPEPWFDPEPEPEPEPEFEREPEAEFDSEPEFEREPEPEFGPEPEFTPEPEPASPALAPTHAPATALLAGLRRHEPRLLLSARDIRRLAPGVTAWLDRGIHPDAVARTLCACLPDRLAHPAGLLAHRLTHLLPPPLPAGPPAPPPRDPFQTCDICDRAFRAAAPGRCRDCGPATRAAA
ncbi:helix-turn-helix domain-containing protein [Streptomyces sp. NPDC090025]|uniref:helix-turn-helix domain-containing protein n=1 Tax=Streptomyces sp. NPDC090025 TaxID=3365922 RepID=UPI0038333BC5